MQMKPATPSKKGYSVFISTGLLLTIVMIVLYSASNIEVLSNELFHPVEASASEKDVIEIQKQLHRDTGMSHSKTGNSIRTAIGPHATDLSSYKHRRTDISSSGEGSGVGNKAKSSSRLVSEAVVSPNKGHDELRLASAFNVIMNTSPVVLFIRSGQTDSEYLKKLLTTEYEVTPPPAVVDLDKHDDGKNLQEYIMLHKLATYNTKFEMFDDIPDVPYLFVNGVSVINTSLEKDIKSLNTNGLLEGKLQSLAEKKVNFNKVTPPSNS